MGDYSRLQKELECAVCLDYYQQPVILSCSHILCKTRCAEHIIDDNNVIICPVCRKRNIVPGGLASLLRVRPVEDIIQIVQQGGQEREAEVQENRVVLYDDDVSCQRWHGVFLRSQNYPEHTWGINSDREAFILSGTDGRQWRLLSPGLTETPNSVSFESLDYPGYFLRHYGFFLHMEHILKARNSHIFFEDSTFRVWKDKWFAGYDVFESVNYPGYFIRHYGYRLQIRKFDGSVLFKKDASFKVIKGVGLSTC